jgi:hemolysin III
MRQEGPPPPPDERRYPLGEEIAHSVSHGVGIVLSIAGLAVMVAFASLRGSARDVVAVSIFGGCLVLLYTASTLYHSIPVARARPVLQVLDRAGIFLLIAGTYTPIALRTLSGPAGWTLLAVLWAAAVAGIVLDAVLRQRFRRASLALYLLMGWSGIAVLPLLRQRLSSAGWALLLAGGAAYTLGTVFYSLHRVRYHHFVWHLFVLAGSILQFLAVLLYVIPRP